MFEFLGNLFLCVLIIGAVLMFPGAAFTAVTILATTITLGIILYLVITDKGEG